MALSAALLTGTGLPAQARAGSGAWFAAPQAGRSALSSGNLQRAGSLLPGQDAAARQQAQSRQQLQRSLDNVNRSVAAIAAAQAAQAAQRSAAQAGVGVPDGYAPGGIWDKDAAGNALAWSGADRPAVSSAGGRPTVSIHQTAARAILNWDTFNVGRDTTVQFQQQSTDAVLNRVVGAAGKPSQIQGAIKGDGTVLVVNQNGVVFSGSSQVNVRNLVAAAAAIADDQFTRRGIYSLQANGSYDPAFTAARGTVRVEAGARLATPMPPTATQGGGYVMLLGADVQNAGSITTPRGQAMLAAGDSFLIRRGVGTDANQYSTTRGNEVLGRLDGSGASGRVANTGLIQSPEGDITLTGRAVIQDGVALSTTTINNRGTIHLSTPADDAQGTVILGGASTTAILLDDSGGTALDSQRDALIRESARQDQARRIAAADPFTNLSKQDDRRDLSRIEIVSGGTAQFDTGSMTLATGGQVMAGAAGRTTVAKGSTLDAAGAVGVRVAMESNNIQINIQGNEQRDAPGARDAKNLNNSDVWVDQRTLVHVLPGVGGYNGDRWYTAGGLLEVGGYLGLQPHGIGEWAAQGGTVVFDGGELVTQQGSSINVSGGTLDVQSGRIHMSWMRGADGRLYEISTAPGDLTYQGLYKGFEDTHARWGDNATRYFYNPVIAPTSRNEPGYTAGRDAGRLVVSTRAAVLEGDLVADTYQGMRQVNAADGGWDGYLQSQNAAARGARLILGKYQTDFKSDAATAPAGVFYNLTPAQQKIVFGAPGAIADALMPPVRGAQGGTDGDGGDHAPAAPVPLPADRQNAVYIDSAAFDRWRLGGILAAASDSLSVDGALQVAPGGTIQLHAPQVHVGADLTARGGGIVLGDVLSRTVVGKSVLVALPAGDAPAETVVDADVVLDAAGLWTNLRRDADELGFLPYQDGGAVTIRSTGDVTLSPGSVIDVSSGAALLRDGSLHGGMGGDVALAAGFIADTGAAGSGAGGLLRMLGDLRAYGVAGGGTLTIESGRAIGIGADLLAGNGVLRPGQAATVNLRLAADYVVHAGEILPADMQVPGSTLVPGRQLAEAATLAPDQTVTVRAQWAVPYTLTVFSSTGDRYIGGQIVPAGTVLTTFNGGLRTGDYVSAESFPDGLALVAPARMRFHTGDIAISDVTAVAGTYIMAGQALARQAAVQSVTRLDAGLFQSGFAHYGISAHDGLTVAEGTALDVAMPVLHVDPAAVQALATGGSLAARFAAWTPPLYQEDAARATLSQRGGASLALQAGSPASAVVASPLTVGAGATVSVDPGQSIDLRSNGGQVTIEGRLNAWGGSISIATLPGTQDAYQASATRSVWIGDDAVLDVAGRAHVARDQQGRAYGAAPDGGSIDIGMSDAFIVIRPGAVLDASGASAQLDGTAGGPATALPRPLPLAGAGGSIGLHSYVGMAIDGTLSAHAGGPGAAGGSLTVEMANRLYTPGKEMIDAAYQVLHNLTLVQQHRPSGLADGLAPGQADAALRYGTAVLGVDQVQAGGFDALTLATHDLLVFDGDIDLSLGRSLNLRNGFLSTASATHDAQVRLAAPYIRLNGGSWAGTPGFYSPGVYQVGAGRHVDGASRLTLSADLIDIYGRVQSGLVGMAGEGFIMPPSGFSGVSAPRAVEAPGFATVALQSTGDVRLNSGGVRLNDPFALLVSGDLTIDAAQIYPASGQRGMVVAGVVTQDNERMGWDAGRSLVIRSNGRPAPVPDSVFGVLILAAPLLDQGGVVRAPLGTIALNDKGGALSFTVWPVVPAPDGTLQLVLRDGSLTSVSAAGLAMPYGGTSDGLTYRGADGTLFSLAGNVVNRANPNESPDTGVLPQGITLGGGSIVAEAGAVLDLSGGGDLRGAGFITGRGGSVDVLTTPLANANPVANQYSNAGNAVYAIWPGYASDYAPLIADKGAGDPAIGRQITVGAGVPGLPAGTYTLLPSSYALMPGAYRVEIGAHVGALAAGVAATSIGSWATQAVLATAHTAVRDALPSHVVITPGQAVRRFSQYNEMPYSDFATSQAALFGNVRPMLPSDGKILAFNLQRNDEAVTLRFDGRAILDAAQGGLRGQVSVVGNAPIDIVGGAVTQPTPGAITVSADTLSAFRARTLAIGGPYQYVNGQGSLDQDTGLFFSSGPYGGGAVEVHDGATLRAGQIFLVGSQITVDGSAVLDTRGMGEPGIDSRLGYLYGAGSDVAVLTVSNGWVDFLPSRGPGRMTVRDGASLLTEGTVAFAAPGGLDLGEVNLGARYVAVSQDQVNIGTSASLAAAQAAGTLQPGLRLTQETLDRLLRPSTSAGVPALERLSLTAGGAFNFYGSVALDTGDSSAQMVFNTPAFYGLGGDGDVVRIATRDFVWNGIAGGDGSSAAPYAGVQPVAVQPGGPGTGSGRLLIDAQTVQFGYDVLSQPQRQAELPRLALGFASVQIDGAQRITANNKGVLTVGQSQDADGTLHGGSLSLVTPLLTGQAGSAMRYVASGAISVSAPAGAAAGDTAAVDELGASLTLQGPGVALNTAVALPSGSLTIVSDGDVMLGDGAQVNLSGRAVTFFDITKYSWGGSVDITSAGGNIVQAAGSRIDVSAGGGDAGSLAARAAAGTVTLGGTLAGQAAEGFQDGRFAYTALRIGGDDFTALNQRLNDAGFFGARDFVLKTGDLTVGDGVRAHQVSIATDGGSLTVDGAIDASGDGPGRIELAAQGSLTLTGRAVLDAHGNTLITDSYGAPIDASNRARITLSAVNGAVSLTPGATLDLGSPDHVARGHLDIKAPRVGSTGASATDPGGTDPATPANATGGDIAIAASGPLTIRGAQSIALNGMARYGNAPGDGNGQVITQDYLDAIDRDSQAFDTAARGNADLQARTAGLAAYGTAWHLRPGVEIDSRTPGGNLTVKGDLDLSGYRYGPDADRDPASARYGAGEPMALVLRAGGDLTLHGSINDGFAPAPATPDDGGWLLRQQIALGGQAVPQDITFDIPFYAPWGDYYYLFPSALTGVGYPVVQSGSVTDSTGAFYGPGAEIPGLLYGTVTITAGTVLTSTVPGGADILLNGPRAEPGRMWAVSPMLAAGSLSASIRLVSGADLDAADSRALRPAAQLAGHGNMVLDDPHNAATTSVPVQALSVVRTGTGDLDLYVGSDYRQDSLYGVYTAGTQVAGTGPDSGYNAPRALNSDGTVLGAQYGDYESTLAAQRLWFTQDGGDFTLSAQGDIVGYLQPQTLSLGDWLWRQGGAELGQRTAWGLNFGSYVTDFTGIGVPPALGLAGYAGVGALGGGNAAVHAGGDIGVAGKQWSGLLAAVAGSGRVAQDGTLAQSGGGTLTVTAGGQISGGLYANLRGDIAVSAAELGTLVLNGYGTANPGDPRPADPYTAYASQRRDAVNFAPGDGVLRVRTLGDAVMGGLLDAGRVGERTDTRASFNGAEGSAASWFTLWTGRTAVDLYSAGANVSPFGGRSVDAGGVFDVANISQVVPAHVSVVAASGNIYYDDFFQGQPTLLMPAADGYLDLLAHGLITAQYSTSAITTLGTASTSMATPLHAAWRVAGEDHVLRDSNYWGDAAAPTDVPSIYDYQYDTYALQGSGLGGTLFMFGPNTVTDGSADGQGALSHLYAVNGDLLGMKIGRAVASTGNGPAQTYYQASKPVRVLAGGDIVNLGGLIVQGNATDVSVVAAEGDILYAGLSIAGPGTLEVSAGGQLYQGSTTSLNSLGPIASGDTRAGADIAVQAGLGAGAPGVGATRYDDFARLYLDPANQADLAPDHPLADQPGKVAKTYDIELEQWLGARFGFHAGTAADALAYFLALPGEQQRIFVRKVYYAELLAGGREYNDAAGPRLGSYLRGRNAIAALFPETDAQGNAIARVGNLTMFQSAQGAFANAGIRTVSGGAIQTLTPGGQTIVGIEGVTPAVSVGTQVVNPAGLITQGSGDIQMYSRGSVLLGLSRIMTTFGGGIQIWSAEGDINAGRGSKTTQVYTPPRLVYDDVGNMRLSPNTPSTGAGIATLAPIQEVPPGDVDLIAPQGTIDAGEAGIRVSGNVNIAALQVVNAANIQVQGESKGIPVVASVNVGALTSASAAASSAATSAQDAVARSRAAAQQALPSIISVQVLGFGDETAPTPASPAARSRERTSDYTPNHMVQVVGRGASAPAGARALTADERDHLGL
ncbi:filamentous haemagglutinin family protein [Bordetella genomosp. 13]|uniref:filamentous haemagglutinin family protein n=1 Tax=Bordetella genomosp. 13 TaxID=463040 RepID=UPI00119F4453|nr:filamentous haemagglutinin family protein [Bordetella genomosp. 13]